MSAIKVIQLICSSATLVFLTLTLIYQIKAEKEIDKCFGTLKKRKRKSKVRIIKTSQQARAEEERYNKAVEEMKRCPECGNETDLQPLPLERAKWNKRKHFFRRRCGKCDCEWESEEF